jgi:hypothetical protein
MTPLRPDRLLRYLLYSTSVTRYLVVSRQRLPMVARYFVSEARRATLLFRVFEMQDVVLPLGGQHMASWVELKNLDSPVLFVGRGCSRAYEASQLPGFKQGSIYFTDRTTLRVTWHMYLHTLAAMLVCTPCPNTVARPNLDAPTGGSPLYGTKTYLCWLYTQNKATNKNKTFLLEMRGEQEARPSGSKIMGTRWTFPSSESLSEVSAPIWFAP